MNTFTVRKNQERSIIIKNSGDYSIKLTGEGAHAHITGLFNLKHQDQLNLNVTIIHASPHTSADTNLRAVVDGQATATINGTIIVEKSAQQTNSFLTEKILLLSPQAHAHAIPNLEIEANDVKCSHAATVSTIDEEQLFYLQSRGITEKKAKQLIANGFLGLPSTIS
jgi:Fe-S cluster assembly protein SufD